MTVRIGIDVGGTFTDFAVERVGDEVEIGIWKIPTTAPDPSRGIFEGLRDLIGAGLCDRSEISEFSVGTTVALNAILEGRGAPTGMLVTKGFRDVLEIGRENRRFLYDLLQEKLPIIVPRSRTLEIDERMDSTGSVLQPLDRAQVVDLAGALVEAGAEAIAVCFLHSYANPSHELLAANLIAEHFPQVDVAASHAIAAEPREFERWLLCAMNAYVMPVMRRYAGGLASGVESLAPDAKLFITHSAGGVMPVEVSLHRPIQSALSGPASGVLGAVEVARRRDLVDFITFDMGGTSCDVAVVEGGVHGLVSNMDLRGHHLALRSVDVNSISAGGGTIAWVDEGGLMRVGPESAGSVPGPACYGRGGSLPTVTDAHLVLGHIDPTSVLGDSIQLQPELASGVIEKLAVSLGISVLEAAAGVLAIADAAMIRAVETVSVERGYDPRDFSLVAFGGAAPMHASRIAQELGIGTVFVPRHAGVLCALGTLAADEYHERSRNVLHSGQDLVVADLEKIFTEIAGELSSAVGTATEADIELVYSLDLRYVGQTSYLELAFERDALDKNFVQYITEQYELLYRNVFGYVVPDNDVEVVTARVGARLQRDQLRLPIAQQDTPVPPRPWRAAFDGSEVIDCLLYRTDSLVRDAEIAGPAVVDTGGSTLLIFPEQSARVDECGGITVSAPQRRKPTS